MKRKLVIFGNHRFAEMVAHYFTHEGGREVVAFTAHERFIACPRLGSLALLPFERIEEQFSPRDHDFFCALEHGRQNAARAEVTAEARARGYRLASFISPAARVSSRAELGEHCLVLEQATIQFDAIIGPNNFLFAHTFFGQSCQVGADNYFGSGCFVDRGVRVGSQCIFGSQVRIAEALEIHDGTQIQPFETIRASLLQPTLLHPILRAPGRVVDRRALNP